MELAHLRGFFSAHLYRIVILQARRAVTFAPSQEDDRVISYPRVSAICVVLAPHMLVESAMAQEFPSGPATMVVGYTPAATGDLQAGEGGSHPVE